MGTGNVLSPGRIEEGTPSSSPENNDSSGDGPLSFPLTERKKLDSNTVLLIENGQIYLKEVS